MFQKLEEKAETILNIYLIIDDGSVVAFRAKEYSIAGTDEMKIAFLKERAEVDLQVSKEFESPTNKSGKCIPYKDFEKLEMAGLHFNFFEEIFSEFKVDSDPLVCVTPVVNGKINNL